MVNILAIEEQFSISILEDYSLLLEWWEVNEESLIIALKSFVIPNFDDLEINEKIEEEE